MDHRQLFRLGDEQRNGRPGFDKRRVRQLAQRATDFDIRSTSRANGQLADAIVFGLQFSPAERASKMDHGTTPQR